MQSSTLTTWHVTRAILQPPFLYRYPEHGSAKYHSKVNFSFVEPFQTTLPETDHVSLSRKSAREKHLQSQKVLQDEDIALQCEQQDGTGEVIYDPILTYKGRVVYASVIFISVSLFHSWCGASRAGV